MSEPVSLDDIKTHLRLDPDDTGEDLYLAALITAARRACERRINRSVVGAALTLTLDRFPHAPSGWPVVPVTVPAPDALEIELPGGAVTAIGGVSYLDAFGAAQQLGAAAYTALLGEPARLAPAGAWPDTAAQPGAVSIAYTVSPLAADDLAMVCQAMRLIVEGWYSHRGALAVDTRGIPTEVPLAVTWLLEPLRKWADD